MKALFDITVVDMTDEKVIAFSREVAGSAAEAADKIKKQLLEAGHVEKEKSYHIHVVAYAPLPGEEPKVIRPTPQMVLKARG